MARPAGGAVLGRCAGCGGFEYSGAPACAVCRDLVDGILEDEWQAFLRQWGSGGGSDETALAEMVADEPDRHDWRVVDAALDRLCCPDCGDRLSRGPVRCPACDLAHGFRYVAVEVDRPGVPPGNEHAIRVNVSVLRRPQVTSVNEFLVRRMFLPVLLVGVLPTTTEAQRMSALIKRCSWTRKIALIGQVVEDTFARLPAGLREAGGGDLPDGP